MPADVGAAGVGRLFRPERGSGNRRAGGTACLAHTWGDLNPDLYFSCGGSESNEMAFKIARQYFRLRGEPGRYKVISRRGLVSRVNVRGALGNRHGTEPDDVRAACARVPSCLA